MASHALSETTRGYPNATQETNRAAGTDGRQVGFGVREPGTGLDVMSRQVASQASFGGSLSWPVKGGMTSTGVLGRQAPA